MTKEQFGRLHLFIGYDHEDARYERSFDSLDEVMDWVKLRQRGHYYNVLTERDGDLYRVAYGTRGDGIGPGKNRAVVQWTKRVEYLGNREEV